MRAVTVRSSYFAYHAVAIAVAGGGDGCLRKAAAAARTALNAGLAGGHRGLARVVDRAS